MSNCTLATLSLRISLAAMAAMVSASDAWAGTAILSWNANSESDLAGYRVYYGESRPYSQRLDVGNVTSYTVGGLLERRTYYFVVTAYDTQNSESGYSNEVSKTIPDTTAPQLSSITAGSISSSSATISWATNEPATSQVDFGLTTAYGSSSPLDTTLVTSHRVTLQSLALGRLYHYRVRSRDAAGNSAVSNDATFTTSSTADTTPPVISAVAASSVTATGATISWTTNEPSDSQVSYGPTTAYGSNTPLNITMVTSHSVALSGLTASTTYHYRVASRDAAGNLRTSGDLTLTTAVASATTSRLTNISTRGLVRTGAQVLIGGFVISGTSPKTVLIRARGGSLGGAPFNNPGVLANPTMQLYTGQTVIAQNNDWQTTDPLCLSPATACGGVPDITATGLDPCRPNPGQTAAPPGCAQESALYVTLLPASYTVIVLGVGGTSGMGLVEVFEDDAGTAKLTNISTRGRVETGANVMIGGFVVAGSAPKTVLIRARGGSLGGAPFNNPGVLANPTMQLFSGSTVIAQNNDWQSTDPLCLSPATACGDAAQITATGLDPCQPNPGQTVAPPGCAQESALYVTLPPGGYTAIVSGVGGTSGMGLVEVFEAP